MLSVEGSYILIVMIVIQLNVKTQNCTIKYGEIYCVSIRSPKISKTIPLGVNCSQVTTTFN